MIIPALPYVKASPLRSGDSIGLVAPASPARSAENVEVATRYLESQGYRVKHGKHLMSATGYLAGNDEERLSDIHDMFRDPQIRAIFMLRGGFGTIRLLDKLDYNLIRTNPKIMVGYSDATALFNAINKTTGLASCFLGPMPGVEMANGFEPFAEEMFWQSMTSTRPFGYLPLEKPEGVVLRPAASIEGRILGGNLTVFNSLLGTPYQPTFKNAVVCFEEIDEKPRKIDALFAQLRLAGLWSEAKAVLLGQFTGCTDSDSPSRSVDEIFEDYFGALEKPVISNLPWGHVARQWTLPLGALVRVTSHPTPQIELLEAPLE